MSLTIVADDLTGACDTGSLFAGHAPVALALWPATPPHAAVRVVDTESRAISAEEALARVTRVPALAPATRYFKKIGVQEYASVVAPRRLASGRF